MHRKFLAVLLVITSLLAGTSLAFAQVGSTSQSNMSAVAVISDSALTEPGYGEEYQTLVLQYRSQLQQYRQAETTAQRSRTEFNQLGTLASLDKAVRDTKNFFILRDQVLITYFQLLKVRLVATLGVPLEAKRTSIASIDQTISLLSDHLVQAEVISDKDSLAPVQSDFEMVTNQAVITSDRARALIVHGQTRAMFDRVEALYQYFENELAAQELSPSKKASLERQLDVIAELVAETDASIQEAWTVIAKSESGTTSDQLVYDATIQAHQENYASSARILGFIEETLNAW